MELIDIIGHCEDIVKRARSGDTNPLTAFAELRAMSGAVADALKEIDALAIAEAEKYHEKSFVHAGLKFTRTDGKRMFRLDHLRQWADAKKALADIEDRAKNAALQAERGLNAVTDQGEVFEPAIVTYGKPSLSISKA
jgi:hypothetical protein